MPLTILVQIANKDEVAKLGITLLTLKTQQWEQGDSIVLVDLTASAEVRSLWESYRLPGYQTTIKPSLQFDLSMRSGELLPPNALFFHRKGIPFTAPHRILKPSVSFEMTGTDKGSKHGYGAMYDALLSPKQGTARSVLEIGVLGNASIHALSLCLPYAEIIGADVVDYSEEVSKVPRARFVKLDLGNVEQLQEFAREYLDYFDVIIDDASHIPAHQFRVVEILRKCLRSDGVMVIEDILDDQTYNSLIALGGKGWDFRQTSGEFDSRCVSFAGPAPRTLPSASVKPTVLFVSQYLERTGAPVLLLNIAPRIRGIEPRMFSWIDGPLSEKWREHGIPSEIGDNPTLAGVDLAVVNTLASASVVQQAHDQKVPSIWMIHESDPAMCNNLELVKKIIDFPELLVFPCRATADAYADLRHHGIRIAPTIVPRPPIHMDRKTARHRLGLGDEFVILSMGTDEPRKGQDDIRRAIRGKPYKLFTVSGCDNPWLYYAAADVYVCSSRIEAYPLAIQEAKHFGLPVITTPVFGCKELIHHGVHGLHYNPGDVDDLREKIDQLYRHRDLYRVPLSHLPSFHDSLLRFEEIFNEVLMGALDPQPLDVVFHVAGMGPWWKSILVEQLEVLSRVGLKNVYVTHVGEGLDFVQTQGRLYGLNLTIVSHDENVQRWECPAIEFCERLAWSYRERPILYLHTKGVSHDPRSADPFHVWRQLMMSELVTKWRENFQILRNGHDAVGVNWWTTPVEKNHFSGNFWIARPSWLRQLVPFAKYYRDRYSCERWIGSVPGCRAHSLVCTDRKFWSDDVQWMRSYVKREVQR